MLQIFHDFQEIVKMCHDCTWAKQKNAMTCSLPRKVLYFTYQMVSTRLISSVDTKDVFF